MLARLRFPIAVALTSLALVLGLGVAGFWLARPALASGPWAGHGPLGSEFALPAELEGMQHIPPDQRFSHFVGAQLQLKDRNNQPVTINATPGIVSAVSATSLTINANDGTSKIYALDSQTVIRNRPGRGGDQATQPKLSNGDKVVVITLNGSTTAKGVVVAGPDGFGPPRWHRGPGR